MNAPGASGPPANRMVVAVLSLIGIFVAAYLTAHHLGWVGSLRCGAGFDCAAVQSSPYATVGPVPVALIGLAGYLALFVLALAGLRPGLWRSQVIGGLLFGGAAFGFLYAVYLTYLEAAVIHAWCQWCLISAVVITLVFIATLPEWRRIRKGVSP
ncbi:MAG: vitamin K epoxide reductase family protein [Gemmatimonadota bacterium]